VPCLDLVKEAFEIARLNRCLWFYGLFAGGVGFNFQATFPGDSGDGTGDPARADRPVRDPIHQVATFVGSLAIVLPVLLLCLPTIILFISGATEAGIVVGVLTGLGVIPLALTAYGKLGTLNHSLWTLTYLELSRARA
jgi:hypothetical protein